MKTPDIEFRIKKTTNTKIITKLNQRIFPHDELIINPRGCYWIVYMNDMPCGFCGIHPLTYEPGTSFFARAGLLPKARGFGLHRRMIRTRMRYCRDHNIQCAITYTLDDNTSSANNLVACGFKIYEPAERWADRPDRHEVIYFIMNF